MIVCNLCGQAIPGVGDSCARCSGKGIERNTVLRSLLTPTQRRGSPDRWARSYTTPPKISINSPLVADAVHAEPTELRSSNHVDKLHATNHFDIQSKPGTDLARVYGSLIDKTESHPFCATCRTKLVAGHKIFLPPQRAQPTSDAYCRSCYGARFKLGDCQECSRPIIGDEEEPYKGGHVRGRGDSMWHAGCFKCETCHLHLYKQEHLLAVSGSPRCLSCYDPDDPRISPRPLGPLRRFAAPGSVLPLQHPNIELPVSSPPHTSSDAVTSTVNTFPKPTSSMTRANYRSSVQYLAKRFEGTGS